MAIQEFQQGDTWEAQRARLNEIVRACNGLLALSGDGLVEVRGAGSARSLGLNLAALQSRIARPITPRLGMCRIASNAGGGRYTADELYYDQEAAVWTSASAPWSLYAGETVYDRRYRDYGAVGAIVPWWWARGRDAYGLPVWTRICEVSAAGGAGEPFCGTFCVHYSGLNETRTFYSLAGCGRALVEIACYVRQCWLEVGEPPDPDVWHHPVNSRPYPDNLPYVDGGDSAGGDDTTWRDLTCHIQFADGGAGSFGDGNQIGLGGGHYVDFDYRFCEDGDLELRLVNGGTLEAETFSAVIYGAVRVTPYPWPATEEIGNCCCHDDDWGEV